MRRREFRKLRLGEDADAVACVLTRRRYAKPRGDFNRPLVYPKLVY
jgi:hypothetical protein